MVSAALISSLLVVLPASWAAADDRTLIIGGTGSALGTMSKLAAAFSKHHPNTKLQVLPSLSSGGSIRALAAGRLDIALTARPLKAKERDKSLEVLLYAKTPVVLATSTSNPATSLTMQNLVRMVAGELTHWPDGTPIGLVIRPPHSAETRTLESMSPEIPGALEKARKRPGVPVARTVQEAADLIQSHKGGLGTASLSMILSENHQIKSLSLDGITATVDTIRRGKYNFEKSFYMVTQQEPHRGVEAFIEFVGSPEGGTILLLTGHLVIAY